MSKKNPSWGGRFTKKPSQIAQNFSSSIDVDQVLYSQDIQGSIAYAEALMEAKVLSKNEYNKIKTGLRKIEKKIEADNFKWNPALEDVHMNIEAALEKEIGVTAKKLHTGRSRNDQVVTDFKLYLLERSNEIESLLKSLMKNLILRAEGELETLMPGFTHLQNAQPISLAHYLMSWHEMMKRDLERFLITKKQLKISPLGSGALSGNRFKLNRQKLAKSLGFDSVTRNSIDAVSDRDFALEVAFNISVMAIHFSRICEELIIWSSSQFNYAQELCTGSSIMPQKKNPDMAELVRGGSAKTVGNLMTLLSLMKNQPLAYNRDNQEDKAPLINSIEYATEALSIMIEMIKGISFNNDQMLADVYDDFLTATDLAEYLVIKGVPFREAHEITGTAVKYAEDNDLLLFEMSLDEFKKISKKISQDVFDYIDPSDSIQAKTSIGGTALQQIKKEIKRAKDYLKK
jgi:argininosuccinate lyase